MFLWSLLREGNCFIRKSPWKMTNSQDEFSFLSGYGKVFIFVYSNDKIAYAVSENCFFPTTRRFGLIDI